MKQGTIWAVVIVVILILAGWWYFSMNQNQEAVVNETGDVAGDENQFVDESKDGAADPVTEVTVRYTADGFAPALVTVKKGTKVTFVNESGGNMWVGADEHPTHTSYDGTSKNDHCIDGVPSTTSFDQCVSGASYSFVFSKVGTWAYHNHAGASDKGTVVVTD